MLVKGGFGRSIGLHGYGGGAALFLHTVPDGIAVIALIHDGMGIWL